MIRHIACLQPGHTPENPGDYGVISDEGEPWGETPEKAIGAYQAETGDAVREYWIRGETLWVITAHAERLEAEKERARFGDD